MPGLPNILMTFGTRQLIGASLILSASVIEVLRQQKIGNADIFECRSSP